MREFQGAKMLKPHLADPYQISFDIYKAFRRQVLIDFLHANTPANKRRDKERSRFSPPGHSVSDALGVEFTRGRAIG
jgi:hypothetical protein